MYRIAGGPFTIWLVETDVMAERGQPILSLVSRVFLNEHERIIEQLRRTGHELLLCYMLQQIEQFRNLGRSLRCSTRTRNTWARWKRNCRRRSWRRSRSRSVCGLPPEERLRGLSSEEILRRFTPEKFADGLSEEQAARLQELLEHRQGK